MRPRELVEARVQAFNRADADAPAAFYASTAVNHQVAETPVQGRDAIRAMFAEGFARARMVCIVDKLCSFPTIPLSTGWNEEYRPWREGRGTAK